MDAPAVFMTLFVRLVLQRGLVGLPMDKPVLARRSHSSGLRVTRICSTRAPYRHQLASSLVPCAMCLRTSRNGRSTQTSLCTAHFCRFVVNRALACARAKLGTLQHVAVVAADLQIYNEHIYDALLDKDGLFPLTVHETPAEGIYVEGLSEFLVTCPGDCLGIIARGEANRAVRGTHMNEYSSRSHSIFQLHIEQQESGSPEVRRSKLNLVDLAGSEKWDTTVEMGREHISELTNINLSLHTLSRCIAALASKTPAHVPFRESRLTRLLRDRCWPVVCVCVCVCVCACVCVCCCC